MAVLLLALGSVCVILALLRSVGRQTENTAVPRQGGMQPLYTLGGHDKPYSVAFSPDGRLLASEWGDKTVRVWRTSDWATTYTLEGDTGWATLVGFSPDGDDLISVSGDSYVSSVELQMSFWNANNGTLLRTLPLVDNLPEVRCQSILTLSPDASTLVYGSFTRGTIRLWGLSDGSLRRTLDVPSDQSAQLTSLAFSLDEKMLAAGQREGVRVWRLSDGTLSQILQTSYRVEDVAFSPDGTLLASGGESTVQIWRLADGALLYTMKSPYGGRPISFSPDGTILAASSDYMLGPGDVQLWRVSDGTSLGRMDGPLGPVRDLAFSPNGQLLAWTADDGTIQVWRVQ